MSVAARFDYDAEGRTLVLADGAELLVHDGRTEAPLYRRELGAPLVGVASMEAGIAALDGRGMLQIFSRADDPVRHLDLGLAARSLSRDALGKRCIVHHDGGAIVIEGARELVRVSLKNASAAAIAPDGAFAIGTHGGDVALFDASGQLREHYALGTPVRDLDHHAGGAWMVAAGTKVFRIERGQASVLTNAPEAMQVRALRCSPDGDRIGLVLDDHMVIAIAYPSRETDGSVIYGDRAIAGLSFGPGDWLGVGLEGGDANKIDLATGAVHRSDTHPGRKHRSWVVAVSAGRREEPIAPKKSGVEGWLGCGAVLLVVGAVAFFVAFT